jgi:hypothetical protein
MEMMDGMAEKRLLERRSVDFNPLNVGARSRKSMALLTVLDIGMRRRIHPCRSRAVARRSVHQAIKAEPHRPAMPPLTEERAFSCPKRMNG